MFKSVIGQQMYDKVSQKIDLRPLDEFQDLDPIVTPDGREVGSLKAYCGEKLKKFTVAEFSLVPGMDYTNCTLKPEPRYNIPRFSVNYMVLPDKIQFDVDLYPSVDIAVRQDYIDKYYELLTELYLREKSAPHFDWKVSDRSWVRVSASPYFFMSATARENEDKVHALVHAYLDVALKIFAEEPEVSDEDARHIESRTEYITKMLLEREPERHLLEKAFGPELTERLGRAMV